jgi:hypothetical protein
MYEKQLIGRRPLYFRYAPPLTNLDDYSSDELPKAPFRGAKPHQLSVYYFWWLFLKEHEGYMEACANMGEGAYAALYDDFCDVRDDDFMAWWKQTGRYLFCEPQDAPIHVYGSPEFKLDAESRLVVSLPLDRDVDEMTAEIKQLLKPLRRAVPIKDSIGAPKYPVRAKPVLSSLYQHHKIWRLRRDHPKKTLVEIADLAGITVDGSTINDAQSMQVKNSTVSRYLKQAKCLIDHVGRGYFPILKPEQARLLGLK